MTDSITNGSDDVATVEVDSDQLVRAMQHFRTHDPVEAIERVVRWAIADEKRKAAVREELARATAEGRLPAPTQEAEDDLDPVESDVQERLYRLEAIVAGGGGDDLGGRLETMYLNSSPANAARIRAAIGDTSVADQGGYRLIDKPGAWSTCLACRRVLGQIAGTNPDGAMVWTSRGNYGSTLYDDLSTDDDGDYLRVVICDECVQRAAEDGIVLRGIPQPAPSTAYVIWKPDPGEVAAIRQADPDPGEGLLPMDVVRRRMGL
jgi:hypothetical protein